MGEENNKQDEARRVLDAIRQKAEQGEEKAVPDQPTRWLVNEDAAQLQALVDQSRGVKNQPPVKEDLPDPENIDPISTEQIKVMRKSVASTKVDRALPLKKLYETLIRAFFEMVEFSKPSTRAKRCLTEGHQCLHCGQKLPSNLSMQTGVSGPSSQVPPNTTPSQPDKQ